MKQLKWLTSVLAVFTGITAVFLVLRIYLRADSTVYTAEKASAALRILVWPAALTLLSAAACALPALREPPVREKLPKPVPALTLKHPRAVRIVFIIAALWAAVYLAVPSHFASRELEQVIGRLLLAVGPAAAVMLVCGALLQPASDPKPAYRNQKAVRTARIALACAAVLLITAGVLNGSMHDVFVKAVNICTECIGLG